MNKNIFKEIDFLPIFAVCFCAGICLARWQRIPFLFLYSAGWILAAYALIIIKSNKCGLFLLLSGLVLGALLLTNARDLADNHIARFTPHRGKLVLTEGIIADQPVSKSKSTNFILNIKKIKINQSWQKVRGKVLVKAFKRSNFNYGERLLLEGSLYRVNKLWISQRLNYREYLKYKNIYSILSVSKESYVETVSRGQGNPLISFAFRIRQRLKRRVDENLSDAAAAVLNAVILGERQDLPKNIKEMLVNSGTVHIIAISGLHLGIVAFLIIVFLKMIRLPKEARFIFAIFILIFYCLLTGSRTPVVRSTFMISTVLIGYILKREVNIYNSLSLAGLIILSINPWQIFTLSFQLSFVSIISIVSLTGLVACAFPDRLCRMLYLRILINIFCVSLAVWLGLVPLIAYYFRIITPVAILANIFVAPFMTIVIATGITFLSTTILSPDVSFIFSGAAEGVILLLLKMISFFSRLPFACLRIKSIPFYYPFFYYLALFFIFYAIQLFRRNNFMIK